MKLKILLLILFIGIFLISFVSPAQSSLGTFKQGEDIELIQTCSDCTYNNITTIKLANGTLLKIDESMTKDGSFFSHTLNSTYTTSLGEYKVNGIGDTGGVDTVWTYSLEVTPNGKTFTTQNAISYLGFIIILLFTFFLTIYGADKIRWKHTKSDDGKILSVNNFRYVKVLLFTMAYFELMFLFGLSRKLFSEAGIDGFTQFFNFIYNIFLYLMYPLIIASIIIVFVIWINNKKFQNKIKLGI